MANRTPSKAAAGFASGFLSVTALLFVLAALMVGLGPTETGSRRMPHSQIGASR